MNQKYNMGGFREKKIVKILSLILEQVFLFYNVGFATVDKPLPSPDKNTKLEELSIDTIGVSKDIGTIKTRYKGKSGKIIIHIQDAHCNYEAQTNISKLKVSVGQGVLTRPY